MLVYIHRAVIVQSIYYPVIFLKVQSKANKRLFEIADIPNESGTRHRPSTTVQRYREVNLFGLSFRYRPNHSPCMHLAVRSCYEATGGLLWYLT